jgi:hypothetical protein
MELKGDNRIGIITMFGIPPKVANISNEKTALSGKDSDEQYRAFWSQTLIPTMEFVLKTLRSKFYRRFNVPFEGKFDLSGITELQSPENDLEKRLNESIESGLRTINQAKAVLHLPPEPYGDTWHRKVSLEDVQKPKVLDGETASKNAKEIAAAGGENGQKEPDVEDPPKPDTRQRDDKWLDHLLFEEKVAQNTDGGRD